MTPLERYFRHQIMRDRIQQLQGEIAAVAEGLYLRSDEIEHDFLNQAEALLIRAAHAIHKAEQLAQSMCASDVFIAQAKASIELVNRSPEAVRRLKP